MGTYNQLWPTLRCPRCGERGKMYAQLHFGYTGDLAELEVGATYPDIIQGVSVDAETKPYIPDEPAS